MGLVPLTEGGGIDLDDGALDKGVCSDKLVVRGVVDLCIANHDRQSNSHHTIHGESKTKEKITHDTNDTSLASNMLRGPGEVTRL